MSEYRNIIPHVNKSSPTLGISCLGEDVLPQQQKRNRYISKTRNETKRKKLSLFRGCTIFFIEYCKDLILKKKSKIFCN